MKVAQWEGQFGIESATNSPTTDDLIYLVNKDRVTGELQRIHNGAATVEAGQTPLDIPITRVTQISFGSASTNAPASNPWEMRAFSLLAEAQSLSTLTNGGRRALPATARTLALWSWTRNLSGSFSPTWIAPS